jgi:hypothetical protein
MILAAKALRQVVQTPVAITISPIGSRPMISQRSSWVANTAWAAELELGDAMLVEGWVFAGCSLVDFMLGIVSGSLQGKRYTDNIPQVCGTSMRLC